ncbi:alpha/beta hydrolase [Kitasatospora sp. MAP5-34]|uniref:RBBP9/YdeN family alpha/beta hydrolase n=1 Tax=Kitasatospora sp. MAP5-34 TaxID=3035102 RepID=UPI00247489DD|nr:alpha/beta hydrolase [Kitasatospora sp. MAP5-34]MDH6577904.1 putative alpha/beta hydrolase family esterase [Kitasatospora sp. MAP5-34]
MTQPTPDLTILVQPGYQNSGPEHWQSRWEQQDGRLRRVQQADWDEPLLGDWVATLDKAVAACEGPVVLLAHSLGCITVAHWAAAHAETHSADIRAALLVAPADIDTADIPELVNFRPVPLRPLPFPSVVVASSDDPWCSPARSRHFADSWGSRFVEIGPFGHLNSASGLGDWPEGRALLAELTS